MTQGETGSQGSSLERLKVIRRLNAERDWINSGLYKLLLDEGMYVEAYERIKSKPGNMTPGSDGKTLDSFSMAQIRNLIEQMRDESYQCKPVRTTYIPKANGKLRKLGIPTVTDKIVQEVVLMILEAVYDSPDGAYFSENSHGFRRSKSPHTALREIQRKWSGVSWFLEGDIQSCFDDIDHEILVEIIKRKVKDQRFINLIWKILKAGYMDLKRIRHDSLAGTPQGGIASPILANIYMHELDVYVDQLRGELEKGKARRANREYRAIADLRQKMAKAGKANTEEYRRLGQQMRSLPSLDTRDPEFVRIKYVRFADDWLVGVTGSHQLAQEIKDRIKAFLAEKLHLTLSEEKTKITNARTEEAAFLGYRIRKGRGANSQKQKTSRNASARSFKRRSTGMEIVLKAPMSEVLNRLKQRGFCNGSGQPTHKAGWTTLDDDQIVSRYSAINRGIQEYYRPADNWPELWRIQYILKYSLAKTLALKRKVPITQVMKSRDISVTVKRKDGLAKITFYQNMDWKVKRDAFSQNPAVDLVQMSIRLRTRSKLGWPCCICGNANDVEMHHVRHVRKMSEKKATGFTRIMAIMNRKQIPVCSTCHTKIHRGEYDGLRLKDLAYDPSKPRNTQSGTGT